jgi:hypothetical protein
MNGSTVHRQTWIHLEKTESNGKEFSRLLYPNPVCFLCHRSRCVDDPTKIKKEVTQKHHRIAGEEYGQYYQDNVMVVSWLTPTNNHGKFVMSLNKRRCTAQGLVAAFSAIPSSAAYAERLEPKARFTLCVPVAGMEAMVLAVGGTSGRVSSKFGPDVDVSKDATSFGTSNTVPIQNAPSKRQEKKRRQLLLGKGIPNLGQTLYGTQDDFDGGKNFDVFCVNGTVAHLLCNVDQVVGNEISQTLDGCDKESANTHNVVDDDHYLVSSTIEDAYCHSDYWDATKKLFRPKDSSVPPFLTFFGSQTFGYTTTSK